MKPIPRIQHIYCLNFFMKLYLVDYIKDLVIPDTNKRLNSAMNLSEYFCVIGCRLIMCFYAGNSIRDLFLKYTIIPQKGVPICLNHIIYGRRLEKITQVMSCTNLFIPEFNDPFFQQRQMWEGWNNNMTENSEPSRVSVLDDSIQECINLYTFPGCMFFPCEPHHFGNECHTISCTKS